MRTDKRSADATLVGFATGSATPVIARPCIATSSSVASGALVKDCITRRDRREEPQDQAVLSYLVHRAGYAFANDKPREVGVRCKCDRWFYHYIGFDVPAGLYARTCLS